MKRCFVLLVCLATTVPAWSGAVTPSSAQTSDSSSFDDAAALRTSQAAIGRALGNYTFRDVHGAPVDLSVYRGKPLLISLVYTSCYSTCSMATYHLAQAVAAARQVLGQDSFEVITVGFDTPNDTPQAMAEFAERKGIALAHWKFLSSDAATMRRLASDVGFTYRASPKGFDHIIQVSVVDADGRLYRQVYGELFPIPALVEPLKQLVYGARTGDTAWTGLVKKVRLFCTTYDPASGGYRFDYSLFVGIIIGVSILGGGVVFLVRGLRRSPG